MRHIIEWFNKNSGFSVFIGGLIIGSILTVILLKNDKLLTELKKKYVNSPIETMVIFTTGIIIFATVIASVLNQSFSIGMLSIILSFFTSFVFSWILTKKSSENLFIEKQKESAIRSYRHSMNIKSKLDYSIKIADLINTELGICKNSSSGKCDLSGELLRVRDFLITAKMDANDNINDWADILSKELNIIEEIKEKKSQIEKFLKQKQNLNLDDKMELAKSIEIEAQILKLNGAIVDSKDNINPIVRHTLEAEEDFTDEYLQHVDKEIESKKVTNMKNKINFDDVQSKAKFEKIEKATNAAQ